jgi:enoyl-CoA hydratase/carnithine racemase
MAQVLAETDGVVRRIVLNHPERLNSLSHEMVDGLLDELDAAAADEDCRVVVLSGTGRAFCAGDDLKGMGRWPSKRWKGRKMGGGLPVPQQLLIKTLRELPKPVVARLHGHVLGMGLDTALACDIRICTENTQLGDPRADRALYAATGMLYQLPRIVGYGRALEMMLLAERISGIEAQQRGLVYRAVPEDQLDAVVDEVVAQLSRSATKSLAVIKQQLREQLDLDYAQAIVHSNAVRSTVAIEDGPEGILAFNEKRDPQFTGR